MACFFPAIVMLVFRGDLGKGVFSTRLRLEGGQVRCPIQCPIQRCADRNLAPNRSKFYVKRFYSLSRQNIEKKGLNLTYFPY